MAQSITLNTDDDLVKSFLSGLTEDQRQLLTNCADLIKPTSNGMKSAMATTSQQSAMLPEKATPQSMSEAPMARKPTVNRGKDLKLLKKYLDEDFELPSKSKQKEHSWKISTSKGRLGNNNSKTPQNYRNGSIKSKSYETVARQMREELKSTASKTIVENSSKSISKYNEKNTRVDNDQLSIKNDEEFQKWVVTLKTGLDSNLVPKRITGINEYRGMIFHLVEWTNPAIPAEIIASKVLSARYPQLVIKYYESLSVSVNIREFREKYSNTEQTQHKPKAKY